MASTNSTTHYELSQYIGTDKPTYLVDYNQDMSKIDAGIYEAKSEADTNSTSIGTLSNLNTTAKTNLVSAINEVEGETAGIGTLSNLTTTVKTDLVSAINEVDSETAGIGTLANLTTTDKTNLVSAINEVDGDVGTLSSLTTTSKTSLVSAINEVDGDVGDLSSLTTTAKSNLVSALNEVDGFVDYMTLTDIRQLSNPTITQGGGSISNHNVNVALNADGTFGKIYGDLYLTGQNGYPRVKFTNTGIKGVTESFSIRAAGVALPVTGGGDQINIQVSPPTGNETSASIELRFGNYASGGTKGVLPASLYYFKDFGDTE